MKYEYRDIWCRGKDGKIIGCQISYEWNADISNLSNNVIAVMQFLTGEIDRLTIDPEFRLWDVGKNGSEDQHEGLSNRRGKRAGSNWDEDE